MRFVAQTQETICRFTSSVLKQGPMRQLFFLLLLLQVCSAFAGGDKPNKKPPTNFAERIKVGVSVTPGFNYRWLTINKSIVEPGGLDDIGEQGVVSGRNKYEVPFIGISAGGRISIWVNKFFTAETGIDYACYMYRNKKMILSGFEGTADSIYRGLSGTYGYNYLNLPLAANFTFGKKKVQGLVSTGCNINFLLSSYAEWIIYKSDGSEKHQRVKGNDPFVRVNISPFIGIGMQYNINPLLQLRIMPLAYVQALKNIHTPITEHLYGAALNVALFFAAKKKA